MEKDSKWTSIHKTIQNSIPEEVKIKINKLKLPNILNLLSKSPLHIIKIIKQNEENLKDTTINL